MQDSELELLELLGVLLWGILTSTCRYEQCVPPPAFPSLLFAWRPLLHPPKGLGSHHRQPSGLRCGFYCMDRLVPLLLREVLACRVGLLLSWFVLIDTAAPAGQVACSAAVTHPPHPTRFGG